MMFASISLGLALLSSVSAKIINVDVGKAGQLLYSPEAVGADPGDQVVFHFYAKNHTVTQSSFANPCGRMEHGLDSGFQPVPVNQTEHLPTYTVTVHDRKPIWIYCAQAANTPNSHCGAGMVFAINCGLDHEPNSFGNFKHAALQIGAQLKANAAPATTAAPAYTTAAYGGYTIPAAPTPVPVTVPVTLGDETWTTTYNSYPNSPAPTPVSPEGAVHTVLVGAGGLVFDPPFIKAAPRDTVLFSFRAKNHTVTQSSFEDPCRQFSANGVLGFDSGFIPVAPDATEFPTWSYTVVDTAPVWAYCRQGNHCGQGMVFAINSDETSGRNQQAFANVAKALNGTAVAAQAPSSTGDAAPSSTPDSGALASVKAGSVVVSLLGAALVAALL